MDKLSLVRRYHYLTDGPVKSKTVLQRKSDNRQTTTVTPDRFITEMQTRAPRQRSCNGLHRNAIKHYYDLLI